MVNERPRQFGGPSRFGLVAQPQATGTTVSASPAVSRAARLGLGLGKGASGLGRGKGLAGHKRHIKIRKDNIYGITKGDIRRIARRGGVKRIAGTIYEDVRQALKERLQRILYDVCAVLDSSGRKTVSVTDVVFTLRRLGNPIYGFDSTFMNAR